MDTFKNDIIIQLLNKLRTNQDLNKKNLINS